MSKAIVRNPGCRSVAKPQEREAGIEPSQSKQLGRWWVRKTSIVD